ncbi:hypothetical protein HMN09_00375400 [Mycena chlorophos]|uniref:Uncharacterized protein n=1 Tax=Mycena chlorophos TaxID=658473 RepID=A0A8H6WNC0_MYCCL|nr:hypothetical protein HMN09_00375400 [Mycena chlorophos]
MTTNLRLSKPDLAPVRLRAQPRLSPYTAADSEHPTPTVRSPCAESERRKYSEPAPEPRLVEEKRDGSQSWRLSYRRFTPGTLQSLMCSPVIPPARGSRRPHRKHGVMGMRKNIATGAAFLIDHPARRSHPIAHLPLPSQISRARGARCVIPKSDNRDDYDVSLSEAFHVARMDYDFSLERATQILR